MTEFQRMFLQQFIVFIIILFMYWGVNKAIENPFDKENK